MVYVFTNEVNLFYTITLKKVVFILYIFTDEVKFDHWSKLLRPQFLYIFNSIKLQN